MLKLTQKQVDFIKENFEESEKMINSDNLDDILLPLDALITYQGFDDNYMLTNWGNTAQRIYDEIYIQNAK